MGGKKDLYAPIHRAMDRGQYGQALRLSQALKQKYPDDETVAHNTAIAHIDAGHGLKDIGLVEKGITWFEARTRNVVLPRVPLDAALLYNLANGYSARQALKRPSLAPIELSHDPDTVLQKKCYRRAIDASVQAVPSLAAISLVNFGNLLLRLGRHAEAADQYEAALEINPSHGAALVHSASALMKISHLARRNFEPHIFELYRRLVRALRSKRSLVRIASTQLLKEAVQDFQNLEGELDRHGGPETVEYRLLRKETSNRDTMRRVSRFAPFWVRQRLFLSINARIRRNRIYWVDEAEPATPHSINWAPTALRMELTERLEEMQADYAVARLLFTLSADRIARKRSDWAVAALLQRDVHLRHDGSIPCAKIAYRVAADILDKAAGHVNALFGFGLREKTVYLATVWHERGDRNRALSQLGLKVLRRNPYARGLYDLSLDWINADLDDRLRQTRHTLTHRYLPIHLDPGPLLAEGLEALTPNEIRLLALHVLRTARAAILHVVGATEMEIVHRLGLRPARGVHSGRPSVSI